MEASDFQMIRTTGVIGSGDSIGSQGSAFTIHIPGYSIYPTRLVKAPDWGMTGIFAFQVHVH